MQHILGLVRRCIDDYHMIQPGNRIAVGVSGGKDSLLTLTALARLRQFYPAPFALEAITLDTGAPDMDFSGVAQLCCQLDVPYTVIPVPIYQVVFQERQEKNPCSLCAKMRRGILHDAAKEMGCNKIALGHHYDDVIDTFMLNLFHEGRIGAFLPVTYLSRKDITLIRPLLYVPEKDIRYFLSKNDLPTVKNPCPEDGHTEREKMKQMINGLDREYKGLKHRIFGAMQKGGVFEMNDE